VPGAELGLAQLGRESEVYSRVYSYLLERQQQAAITKASTVSKNRILDFPQEPYREDAPKLLLRLLSAPLALLLGAVLVLLHRMFASTLQSASEARRAAYGVPVYASIPRRPRIKGRTKTLSDAHSIDVLARAPNSPFAEAFRTLRTNLYHWGPAEQGRVTLFTSPTPGDGKTTCVLSLAGILTADKKRVLVVDADLRKPSHHDLTDQGQGPGLRGILSGQCHWIDVVHPVRLSVGTYDSISAGKMAPAELLSSERMSRFVNDAKQHYDFILIDSPSFPLVSDALVLSDVADCVLSVFRLRNTPRKLAAEHVRGLSSAAEVYGAIINDAHAAGTAYPGSMRAVRVPFDRPSEPPSDDQTGAAGGGKFAKLLAVVAVLAAVALGAALAFQGGDARQLVRARLAAFRAGSAEVIAPTPPAVPATKAALPAVPSVVQTLPESPAPVAPQSADAPPAPKAHAAAAPVSELKKPAPKPVANAPKPWMTKPGGAAQPKPWQQAAQRAPAPSSANGKVAPATRTWVPRAKVATPSMDAEVPPVLSVRPAAAAQGLPAAPLAGDAPAAAASASEAQAPADDAPPAPREAVGAAPTPEVAKALEQPAAAAAAPELPTPPPPSTVAAPTPPASVAPGEPAPAAPAAPSASEPAAATGARAAPAAAPVQAKPAGAAPLGARPAAARPAGSPQSKVQPAAPAR
jgi:Mrp family chromosome partitioning ATPase